MLHTQLLLLFLLFLHVLPLLGHGDRFHFLLFMSLISKPACHLALSEIGLLRNLSHLLLRQSRRELEEIFECHQLVQGFETTLGREGDTSIVGGGSIALATVAAAAGSGGGVAAVATVVRGRK